MRLRLRTVLAVLLAALAVVACGNKGDLVLPDPPDPAPAEDAAAPR